MNDGMDYWTRCYKNLILLGSDNQDLSFSGAQGYHNSKWMGTCSGIESNQSFYLSLILLRAKGAQPSDKESQCLCTWQALHVYICFSACTNVYMYFISPSKIAGKKRKYHHPLRKLWDWWEHLVISPWGVMGGIQALSAGCVNWNSALSSRLTLTASTLFAQAMLTFFSYLLVNIYYRNGK